MVPFLSSNHSWALSTSTLKINHWKLNTCTRDDNFALSHVVWDGMILWCIGLRMLASGHCVPPRLMVFLTRPITKLYKVVRLGRRLGEIPPKDVYIGVD